jgi:hypothetical protein
MADNYAYVGEAGRDDRRGNPVRRRPGVGSSRRADAGRPIDLAAYASVEVAGGLAENEVRGQIRPFFPLFFATTALLTVV